MGRKALILLGICLGCVGCGPSAAADRLVAIEMLEGTVSDVESWTERPGRLITLMDEGTGLRSLIMEMRKEIATMALEEGARKKAKKVLSELDEAITQNSVSLNAQQKFDERGKVFRDAVMMAEGVGYQVVGERLVENSLIFRRSTAKEELSRITTMSQFKDWMRSSVYSDYNDYVEAAWSYYVSGPKVESALEDAKKALADLSAEDS